MENHHHHITPARSQNRIFILSIILNSFFVLVEVGVGLWQDSLSLLSDAGHNLSDVFSLVLVVIAFRLAKVQRNEHFTYGYRKSTILISLLNAVILLVAVGAIVIESIHKFGEPAEVNGIAVSWTAGVGILINGATALLLMRGQKSDINVRGAFLHMAADTLVSIGVVISGILIFYTGWDVIDPIMSLVIAAVILFSTWNLLSDSIRLAVDGIPNGVDLQKIKQLLIAEEHVKDIHHIHVWAISTTETAITAHVVTDELMCWPKVAERLKLVLSNQGITHITLEPEMPDSHCHDVEC
ncbi:MAG: cation transporter [Bacteroidaceae bacterium]|nr:cation transporter [Bacteroidaceae bacterium]